MTTTTPQPKKNIWYKNPILLIFVIGLPLAMVIICIIFIVYAVKVQDSTVRDDWYMDGKALYQDASKDELAYELGLTAIMRFDNDKVTVTLKQPADKPAIDLPATLNARISHATDKQKDRDATLTLTDGIYTGQVSLDPTPAKYYLQLDNGKADKAWRLIHAQKLPADNVPFFPLKAFEKP